jgi:hypothetical protein
MTANRKPIGEVECLVLAGSCRSAMVGPSMPAVDPLPSAVNGFRSGQLMLARHFIPHGPLQRVLDAESRVDARLSFPISLQNRASIRNSIAPRHNTAASIQRARFEVAWNISIAITAMYTDVNTAIETTAVRRTPGRVRKVLNHDFSSRGDVTDVSPAPICN